LEEQVATLRLVHLADRRSHVSQTTQRTQEASVRLIGPANVSAATPTARAQGVEATVITDTKVGVLLDVVPAEFTQTCPGVETTWVTGNHGRHGGTTISLRRGHRLIEFMSGGDVQRRDDGTRRPLRSEMHGMLVGHGVTVRPLHRSDAASEIRARPGTVAYRADMQAVTVETAQTIAIVVVLVLILLAVAAARLMASITQKVIGVVVLAGLAGLVWSQRASITDCANTLKEKAETASATKDLPDSASCTFFGYELEVTLPEV
jgi:hypothetical protein